MYSIDLAFFKKGQIKKTDRMGTAAGSPQQQPSSVLDQAHVAVRRMSEISNYVSKCHLLHVTLLLFCSIFPSPSSISVRNDQKGNRVLCVKVLLA